MLAGNGLTLDLVSGRVVIRLRSNLAPLHVNRIVELADAGFYDGLLFHRVIEGFMAQAGDPLNNYDGPGSGQRLPAEFSGEPFVRGVCGMARDPNDPNGADSQFFIMFERTPRLDGNFTIWGEVIEGMEHIDQLKKGDPNIIENGVNGLVHQPDKIISMRSMASSRPRLVMAPTLLSSDKR